MREALTVIFLAASLAACAAKGDMARAAAGVDLASYRRLGVLPFSDSGGAGRLYGPALAKELFALGFDMVPTEAIEATMKELDVPPGEPFGPATLSDLRQRTKADALVFGALECPRLHGEKRVSVIIMETLEGNTLFQLAYHPKSCGKRGDAEESATYAAKMVRRVLKRRGDE
jgi:hypothetical protein